MSKPESCPAQSGLQPTTTDNLARAFRVPHDKDHTKPDIAALHLPVGHGALYLLLKIRRTSYSYHQAQVESLISHMNTVRYQYLAPSASQEGPL